MEGLLHEVLLHQGSMVQVSMLTWSSIVLAFYCSADATI